MGPAVSVPGLGVGEQQGRGEAEARHPLRLGRVELVERVAGLVVGGGEIPKKRTQGPPTRAAPGS
jgi:hypothetical protein